MFLACPTAIVTAFANHHANRSALVGVNFTWVPLSYSQSRPAGDGEIKSSVVFGGRALEVHAVRRNCSA
jgi:hypothetical protein